MSYVLFYAETRCCFSDFWYEYDVNNYTGYLAFKWSTRTNEEMFWAHRKYIFL